MKGAERGRLLSEQRRAGRWVALRQPLDLGRRIGARPDGLISGLVLALVILAATLAPILAQYDPVITHEDAIAKAPSGRFLLGTDIHGRDLLARLLYGARVSLVIAFAAVGLGTTTGAVLGLVSGYLGGAFDKVSQRILEILMAVPSFILAMMVVFALGGGVIAVIVAIGMTRIATVGRVIRGLTLSIKEEQFVEAARAIGASRTRIIMWHVAPQAVPAFIVMTTLHFSVAILTESSLSFLGIGVSPVYPTWGNVLAGAFQGGRLSPEWWVVVFPGLIITIVVLCFNLLGDALRDVWDPRLRGRI
ncbi:MAG: ABC transporter permease [Chloroflexota bacterium]|nr:ABC transporter permease [Chloroflexota bacterium]